jgi:protein involved in polysaccharide export with SLBB domain
MLECKTLSVCLAATLLMCVSCFSQTLSAQEKQHSIASPITEYRIHAGDVIKLDVWKEPEISRPVPVDRKGYIHLPLIHDVKAAGLTAMELAGLLRRKLEGKIPNLRSL